MADKSNPFRQALRNALGELRMEWSRPFPDGASIDLYTQGGRWLALMIYQSRPSPNGHWWNIPHHFEPLRALERSHPCYLVAGVYQDDPEAGRVATGVELEEMFVAHVGTGDRAGNAKIKPQDFRGAPYLRGAVTIAAYLQDLFLELPPDPAVRAEDLIPRRTRLRRKVTKCCYCGQTVLDRIAESENEFEFELKHLRACRPDLIRNEEGLAPFLQVLSHFRVERRPCGA